MGGNVRLLRVVDPVWGARMVRILNFGSTQGDLNSEKNTSNGGP